MPSSTKTRLTGERPQEGVTPDSLLALHEAGYRAVLERMGDGSVLDVGCGQGFESIRFLAPGRRVVGADYSGEAVATAAARYGPNGLVVAQTNAGRLGFAGGSFDAACSSHLIEHFTDPEPHVAELARVIADDGAVFVLTQAGRLREPVPPPSVRPPRAAGHARAPLRRGLARRGGRPPHVRPTSRQAGQGGEAPATRRARREAPDAALVVRVGVHHLLPLAYKLVAHDDSGGSTGITADDWFVSEDPDDTTLVLFAVARRPRRSAAA